MIKKMLLFLVGAGMATELTAQQVSVSGYIRDSKTGENLIGATVYEINRKLGTNANNYGYYSLSLPAADSATLAFQFIGYLTQVKRLALHPNVVLTVHLIENPAMLKEVTVSGTRPDENVQRTQMSAINIPMAQIKAIPTIAGERDILKVIQFLPGVQSGNEGTTGFFVRGGNIDQNLVLLDEATVYNPNHLFGLVSTFNVNAINSVNLIKGGFPAQFGGRLSSVLEVTMREGNKYRFSGEGGIGIISSNLTLEGPIIKEKASFIVSARRSYLDLLMKPFATKGNKTDYALYDVNMKANVELNKQNHLFASVFQGNDHANYTGSNSLNYQIDFGNRTATLRWNHLFGSKLFSNTSLIYNNYHLGLSTKQDQYFAVMYTGIRDLGVKTMLEWYPSVRHNVKYGGQFIQHAFSPGTMSAKVPKSGVITKIKPDNIIRNYGREWAAFINDEVMVSDRVGLSVGVRLPVYQAQNTTYTRAEPRLTLKYKVAKATSVKAAYTVMNQFLHLVPNSTASLPTDLWIGSSAIVKPQLSYQGALGVFRNFNGDQIESSLELYYKTMQNQVLFKEGVQIVLDSNLPEKLTFGKGKSYGAELFVRKNQGRLTGWVAYTLSRTTQKFMDLNNGQSFPFTYDRRHLLSAVASYQLNARWSLAANFVFNTGNAFTLPTGRVPVAEDGTLYDGVYYDFTGRNNYRLKSYNRLDFSASYRKERHFFHWKYQSEWVFSAYNLYSRRNPYFVYLTTDVITKQPKATQISLLPIIPGVSYNFKF